MFKDEEKRDRERRKVLKSLKELGEAKIQDLRKALNFQISGETIGRYLSSSDQAEKKDDRLWRYRPVGEERRCP